MPKKTNKTEQLEITVTRSWPLNRIKQVEVQVAGKDSWRNQVTLNKEQSQELVLALQDILGVQEVEEVS